MGHILFLRGEGAIYTTREGDDCTLFLKRTLDVWGVEYMVCQPFWFVRYVGDEELEDE